MYKAASHMLGPANLHLERIFFLNPEHDLKRSFNIYIGMYCIRWLTAACAYPSSSFNSIHSMFVFG